MFSPVPTKCQKALLTLTIALGSITAGQVVQAQNSDMNMDSLLPPEVVPLDPSAASALAANQADSRSMQMGQDAAAPGLVGGDNGNTGMQSAQDYRKSAFDALYNQGQLPQQPQWRAGQANQPQGAGQQPGFAPPGSPQYGQYPNTPGMTAGALYSAHQTQTLSGAPKNQAVRRDIRKGGFTHALSAIAGFGAGAITRGALMNPQSSMMGLGMFGATMTGFGVRNASRF